MMKNKQSILSISLLAALSWTSPVSATAQNETRWHNVDVNQQNREPRRAAFFAFEDLSKAQGFDKKQSANYLSMEGTWKFNFVKDHNKRPLNFFKANFDDSNWKDFPVPGLFELNGYGDPTYKNIGYAWATQFDPERGAIPYLVEDLEAGLEKEHDWGQHSGDLVDKGLVQLHIQQRQYGLGCIDSWMSKPMEKYRMHYGDREFKFVIKAK